jgi:hypothetical protein
MSTDFARSAATFSEHEFRSVDGKRVSLHHDSIQALVSCFAGHQMKLLENTMIQGAGNSDHPST